MIKIILDAMWAYTKTTAVIGVGAFIIVFGVVGSVVGKPVIFIPFSFKIICVTRLLLES